MATILVVEDKRSLRSMITQSLVMEGYRAMGAEDAQTGLSIFKKQKIDLVLTDLKMPGQDGLSLLLQIKAIANQANKDTPVILMTAFGDIEIAVQAMKQGASDFLTKPIDLDHLFLAIKETLETAELKQKNSLSRSQIDTLNLPVEIVGSSRVIRDLFDKVKRVASKNTTVLLLGESGTGKELFARAVHHLSPRRERKFVPINCAAIPDTLLENELFGYEKGAFTGAAERKLGKFELAHLGSIFLDEVGDLNLNLQAKLLRVLQERQIERLGGSRLIPINARVIAASNIDLKKAIEEKKFREDLYFRLSIFPLTVPPLRDRKDDIPELIYFFIKQICEEFNISPVRISQKLINRLCDYQWRGNVRELRNTLERAILLSDGHALESDHIILPEWTDEPQSKVFDLTHEHPPLQEVSKDAASKAEIQYIRQVLKETGGNKSKAAKLMGVSYKTLLNKLKWYNLD
ncbi:MAG: hypothetical protein B6244_08650 [Candidatus Cloacimonetes bacterium 4572_55]|nr:MAG: hypothetical protein B6244_08650 [Candidatus Cloacimonetes bacterium 4572_55]